MTSTVIRKTEHFASLVLVAVFVLSLNAMNWQAHASGDAQDIFANFENELPDIKLFTKEELIEKTEFVKYLDPFDDEFSSFRVFVPKEWSELEKERVRHVKIEDRLIGEIAKFESDPHDVAKSTLTIEAHELKLNVSAKNWLISHLIDYGYVIEGLEGLSDSQAEAVAVIYDDEGLDYKERLVAKINGKRVILMRFSTPVFKWESEKSLQASTAKTFKVLKDDPREVLKRETYDLSGYINFKYLESWTPGALNTTSYDRTTASLIRFDKDYEQIQGVDIDPEDTKSSGVIYVTIVLYNNLDTTIVEEVDLQKKAIEEQGYVIKEKVSHDIKLKYPQHTSINTLDIYNASLKDKDYDDFEVWMAFMKDKEYFYIVSMVTADKGSKYYKWVENKTAFELIVSTLEPILY